MGDELRDIIESMRARIQAELDGQLHALAERHQQQLAEARRTAAEEGRRHAVAEAEQQFAVKIQIARDEAQRRAQEAIVAVRAELERSRTEEAERLKAEFARRQAEEGERLRADVERAKADAERRAAEAASRVRAEMEQALAAEREQAKSRVEVEQRRASEELQKARAAFDAVRAADRAAHEAARLALEAELATRAAAPAQVASHAADALVAAFQEIDAATTLSDTLAAIARAASRHATRAAVFVASGEQLREWEVPGAAALTPAPLYVRDTSIGVVGDAVRRRQLVHSENGGVPSFAGDARSVAAAPLLLAEQVVGVVYADGAPAGDWVTALDVIASHGSVRLGYLTAMRTAQAMRWIEAGGATVAGAPSSEDDEQAARRYARLLVSELKLYNESAVHAGREHRDLLRRLGSEIERARRMFEERVSPSVPGRAQMFHTELVQTLANGDASLLG